MKNKERNETYKVEMFICRTACLEVHIISHSSVKTSNFIHFTKPSDILTCNVSIEKYENDFFKI